MNIALDLECVHLTGGSHDDAVGVCANEMGDPQLALFLCNLLGKTCDNTKLRLLGELIDGKSCPHG